MRHLSWALPVFLVSYLFACTKPTLREVNPVWNEKNHPVISRASVFDTIRVNAIHALDIREVHGVNARYRSGRSVSYFEYDTDTPRLLTFITCLPFQINNGISDTTCRLQNFDFSLSNKKFLPPEEVAAADFFWDINPKDYRYYECLKSPERHTLLIHKQTGRVLHRIEFNG